VWIHIPSVVVVLSTFAVLSHFWAFCIIMARNPRIRANRLHIHVDEHHPFVELSSEQTPESKGSTGFQPDSSSSLCATLLVTVDTPATTVRIGPSHPCRRFPLPVGERWCRGVCLLAMWLAVESTFGFGSDMILVHNWFDDGVCHFGVCGDSNASKAY
jgi:hypothetical protein